MKTKILIAALISVMLIMPAASFEFAPNINIDLNFNLDGESDEETPQNNNGEENTDKEEEEDPLNQGQRTEYDERAQQHDRTDHTNDMQITQDDEDRSFFDRLFMLFR